MKRISVWVVGASVLAVIGLLTRWLLTPAPEVYDWGKVDSPDGRWTAKTELVVYGKSMTGRLICRLLASIHIRRSGSSIGRTETGNAGAP
jgi:hypothetical protein